ncbi:MAG: hypothetical protein L0Y58_07855 [Verrucomicrobia subdivision 3 bacterium]|nr:hypothetical protein [Limisphaerales bacterium]
MVFAVWSFAPATLALSADDDRFLDTLERASFRFFWESADPNTGLVKDRSRADGQDPREVASIAATGFGLTALCIAHERRYFSRGEIESRVLNTLRFLWDGLPHERGFYYHFVNFRTGERVWKCELSSIDTALLLCGVLTARRHFRNPEIRRLGEQIYHRVDWRWMLKGSNVLAHGWKPETGFLKSNWDHYCELMMLYLLAIGSPSNPAPAETWHAFTRPVFEYNGLKFISSKDPLFIHQYSHAWFDFRNRRDAYADYFENSVIATKAHKQFCLDLRDRYPHFADDMWGVTASDSAKGYRAWGGPPEHGDIDGTLVPCAAAGSLPFLAAETIQVLRALRARYGERIWKRYGFIDAFNPQTGWHAPDVIGIDVGISMLMAENLRSEFVWRTFMKNPEATAAMDRAGLTVPGN